MTLLISLFGLIILAMGRQVFWIFVAASAFVLALIYGDQYYTGQSQFVLLLIGAVAATFGALLAQYLEKITGAIIGFIGGWYLAGFVSQYFGLNFGEYQELAAFLTGLICGFLILVFFDWSVIIFSALLGSGFLVSGTSLSQRYQLILFASLAILGIVIQGILHLQDEELEE